MSTTRLPALILALLEKFNGLTYPTMLGENSPVYISDGSVINGPNMPAHYLAVGVGDPAANAHQDFLNLGGTSRDEYITVECEASSYVGGTVDPGDYTAASDAQRQARTNAFAILAAIETALRSDKTLTVTDPPAIYWCEVGKQHIDLHQTADDDPESEKGRIATVTFDIYARAKV